jgi:hypothetical protein
VKSSRVVCTCIYKCGEAGKFVCKRTKRRHQLQDINRIAIGAHQVAQVAQVAQAQVAPPIQVQVAQVAAQVPQVPQVAQAAQAPPPTLADHETLIKIRLAKMSTTRYFMQYLVHCSI